MKDDLRTALTKRGATENMLGSKTFTMAEQAIAEDAVDEIATANRRVSILAARLDSATDALDDKMSSASRIKTSLEHATSDALAATNEVKRRTQELGAALDSITVKDGNLMDAINAYTLILARTKQVLGDDAMTEAVLVQLLETASYGLWRSIMGPKDGNNGRRVL